METKDNLMKDWMITAVMCLAPVLIGIPFMQYDQQQVNIIMVYTLCCVLTARFTSQFKYPLIVSLVGIVTLNYFFVEPVYDFAVYNPYYVITFVVMFIVTTLVSAITIQARDNEKKAIRREEDANILYALASGLSSATSKQEILEKGITCIHNTFGCNCSYIPLNNKGLLSKSYLYVQNDGQITSKDTLVVRNVSESDEKLEGGILKGNLNYEWPIQGFKGLHGYIGIPIAQAEKLTPSELFFVSIIADTVSIAVGRLINLEDEQTVKREAEQERYKSNLLRSISHDIRNPLTGIMGTAQLIMDDSQGNQNVYDLASSIRKQASWLLELVSNILSLTRLQNGTLVLKKEVEIVEDVVAEAIHQVRQRSPERTVDFEPPFDVIAAKMDPKLIQQVVINLIDNAFKHTKPDEKVWVVLKDGAQPGWVTIEVHDRGEGLSDEAKQKVFKIFYTTHSNDPDAKKGYGLGLPICDSIMKAHGGHISADNNSDGKGAVFTITFPTEMDL